MRAPAIKPALFLSVREALRSPDSTSIRPKIVESTTSREFVQRWFLALGCFGLLLFFFSPSWAAFSLWARVPEMGGMLEVRRGASVLAQVAHPGAEIADPLHRAIQWRLLFPIIGHLFHLPTPVFFGLADLGCLCVLGYVVSLLRRSQYGWIDAALGTLTIGAASWLFVSTGWLGYFDSWLALALLIVAFAEHRWAVWAACLWAPWVDERFVVAVPVALLCRWLRDRLDATIEAERRFDARNDLVIPLILAAAFGVVRLWGVSRWTATGATVSGYFAGKSYLDAPPERLLLGAWEGLRAGWVLIVVAVLLLRGWAVGAAAVGIAAVLMTALGLATAQDYSRSMTLLLPLSLWGLLLMGRERPKWRRPLLAGTTAAALLLPAHHVMQDAVNPIYYLYHELAAFDSPVPAAMPELRELRALHELEDGDFAPAEADLTLAIKLSDHPESAARQRGRLYAAQRRWEDAKRDFSTVVERDPDNPEGWFLRAQVELAMHDFEASRADLEHAKSIAPPEWSKRPDVTRMAELLTRASAQR